MNTLILARNELIHRRDEIQNAINMLTGIVGDNVQHATEVPVKDLARKGIVRELKTRKPKPAKGGGQNER